MSTAIDQPLPVHVWTPAPDVLDGFSRSIVPTVDGNVVALDPDLATAAAALIAALDVDRAPDLRDLLEAVRMPLD